MEAKLIKIDRNGSKHFEGMITCDRCGGSGIYVWMVCNGVPVPTIVDNGVCHKCFGAGKVKGKWIERTPEYQAKLDAKREAKAAAERAKWEAEEAQRKAEREAREAAERAAQEEREAQLKALREISKHVGTVGERMSLKVTYERSGSWEQKSFRGFGVDTMFAHIFKDADGNVFTWKTQKGIGIDCGTPVILTGTVKDHTEYKGEKQTQLTRCKIEARA